MKPKTFNPYQTRKMKPIYRIIKVMHPYTGKVTKMKISVL